MRKLTKYLTLILFAVAIISCSDDDNETVGPLSEEVAKSQALSALSGTAGTVSSTDLDTTSTNQIYYDVDVVTSEGAVIEFEYFLVDGELKSIEGDQGPFDYEVTPGLGLVNFSEAKNTALGSLDVQPGEVLKWDLEIDETSGEWEYTFEVMDADGAEYTVKINGINGTII